MYNFSYFTFLAQILIFLVLIIVIFKFFKKTDVTEGMITSDKFIFKQGSDIYDDFYANIYDYLVYNLVKNDFEYGAIVNSTSPTSQSVILDVGCGTGHHVNQFASQNFEVIGIDISKAMIDKSISNYPELKKNFIVGDVLNSKQFYPNSFTHIMCLYFTIYNFKDKTLFFNNCYNWLMPGGYLIVHLVDKDKFDPILPPGNPLYIVSPQRYAKKRITKTSVIFNDFKYNSEFKPNVNNDNTEENVSIFEEKIKFNNGNYRKHEHKFYMENINQISSMATECGFALHSKIDMLKCAYESQFLYIFVKPE